MYMYLIWTRDDLAFGFQSNEYWLYSNWVQCDPLKVSYTFSIIILKCLKPPPVAPVNLHRLVDIFDWGQKSFWRRRRRISDIINSELLTRWNSFTRVKGWAERRLKHFRTFRAGRTARRHLLPLHCDRDGLPRLSEELHWATGNGSRVRLWFRVEKGNRQSHVIVVTAWSGH